MFLKTMLQKIKKETGAVIVLTAVMLPVMLGLAGLGFDVGNLYMHKSRLQNVADSAALAGARELINEMKTNPNVLDDIADGGAGRSRSFKESDTADSFTGSNHPEADKATNAYIIKNIASLHNEIKSDDYSHLAIKPEDNQPTFYRVGLEEQVPLYFLPVILGNQKVSTVRAEAIAVAETTAGANPNPGGSGHTVKPSIFDTLFTYSANVDFGNSPSGVNGQTTANVSTSFYGTLIFTYNDGNGGTDTTYYDSTGANNNGYHYHVYNSTDGGANPDYITDPLINTAYDTTIYAPAFRKKVEGLASTDANLTTSSIIDYIINNQSNVLYINKSGTANISVTGSLQEIKDSNGNSVIADNVPVYIIVGENITTVNLTVKNNVRPIVLASLAEGGKVNYCCNEGTNEGYNSASEDYKAHVVIYAPFGDVDVEKFVGYFYGSIVARTITISPISNAVKGIKRHWVQQNFMEGYNGYTDTAIKDITDSVKDKIEETYKELTDAEKVRYVQEMELIEKENKIKQLNHVDFWKLLNEGSDYFYSLRYKEQQAIYNAWRLLYEKYRNSSDEMMKKLSGYFPWQNMDYFSETEEPPADITTLRLINPRTEYTTSNPFASVL